MIQEQGGITIRPSVYSDLDVIAAIALQLFPNNFTVESTEKPIPLEQAKGWIHGNYLGSVFNPSYLVAQIGGHGIVGYTHFRPTANAAGVIAIDEWGVIPVEGVRGIGTRLIEETERALVESHPAIFKKSLASLLVYTGKPGVNLCVRLGFTEAAKFPDLYGSGMDEYIMRKDF